LDTRILLKLQKISRASLKYPKNVSYNEGYLKRGIGVYEIGSIA